MRTTLLAYLKAIAAIAATILGSGLITGKWFGDGELVLSVVNGVVVALTPNIGYTPKHVRRRLAAAQTQATP